MDLTMDLVDRFLAELQDGDCAATKPYCRILPASVLSSLMESGAPLPSPAAYLDLLSTEIVVLPLLQGDHWSVTMVFRLNTAATEPATIAFLDTFDSRHHERTIHAQVRTFLSNVHRESRPRRRQPLNVSEVYVKVPFLRDPNDSGISVLLNVQTTLVEYSETRSARERLRIPSSGINLDGLYHRFCDVAEMVPDKRDAMLRTLRCL
ncbi:hypothetical protein SPRG_09191 [Saprolegnia parasitica CBS 223.65]|uniref:Ubiquitin-like protease family profile domain-containing protein n=1 Tax=Saprolegnia parasitica (strain CBS 223.65) TaxID=695850 RepID=A0A067CFP0_SAPPC|nr:hypothetical protein SPRG_09191 [Saprolegnia parasitica CBS 223.65]KDO25366.1 hypothetical protein SPRG_09191 [Saprolegnia parasitica CBS 223.65]|eukprot:XP_012204013.1 hypothetical protein SPRG_09191 [Saprolegnia parasitica CBS 223.65]